MEGVLLMFSIIAPIASMIGCYQCFNHGRLPCVETHHIDNLNRVLPNE